MSKIALAIAAVACWAAVAAAVSFDKETLSAYLDKPDLARKLATNKLGNFTSYSGLLSVNETYGSKMFFWYFPAQNQNKNAPLLIWLQGGPGASSLFGLFTENGPFSVNKELQLIPNPGSWNGEFSMMYIDNPVGVGFSSTQSPQGFSTSSEIDVANNLYALLTQFLTIFPDQRASDLYITCESYGGKYCPSFAYKIHTMNQVVPQSQKVNLKGISIGDGAMHPEIQFADFSSLLYTYGYADENERDVIHKYEQRIVAHLKKGEYIPAFYVFDEMLNGDFYPYPTYFTNITGSTNYFNIMMPKYPSDPFAKWLNLPEIRDQLHVGSQAYWSYNATVEKSLLPDWMRSVANILPTLLENYKVLIYNGNLDLILGPVQTERFLRQLRWSKQHEYVRAPKQIWVGADGRPAGYVHSAGNFRQIVFLRAGHMVPSDQPENALDMITRFIKGLPFA